MMDMDGSSRGPGIALRASGIGPGILGGVAEDLPLARREVTRGHRADPCSEPVLPRDLRPIQSEGGRLTTALRQHASVAPHLPDALDRASLCARVAADNKGRDVLVLDMRRITPIYDFLVLVTGSSRRQMHAIAEEIDDAMRNVGDHRIGIEGYEASRWIVQDYGDIMVHIFDAEMREYYRIEELWADAERVDWERL
jgi:ribosome-associated protein